MAALLGMLGTGDFPADHRPENWREKFLLLEPNGSAPLTAMLAMLNSESTDDPVYHNFRKDLPGFTFLHSGSALAAATTITAVSSDDLSFFRAGMLVRNYRTGEVLKITSKPTPTTLNVTRGVGQSGTGQAINANDVFFMVGNSNPEGGDTPEAVQHNAASTTNHCQIFRDPVKVTRTAMQTNFRTGDQYKEKARDSLKHHMMAMERAFLWGRYDSITGSNGEPERYTGGLISALSTNVLDLAAASTPNTLTEQDFDAFLAQYAFAYGSSSKLAIVGWRVADLLQRMAKDRWQIAMMNGAGSYGITFTAYDTFAGRLMVKTHPMFRQISGAEDMMLIVDTADLRYRYVQDTVLLKDRQSPGIDGVVDEYLTECGLELLQEKTHALILGWQQVA